MDPALLAEVAARVERAEAAARRLLDELAASPGDAHAVFGGVTAFISRGVPNTFFNRAVGLSEADAGYIPAIVGWYRDHDVPPRLDLAPTRAGPVVRELLRASGLAPERHPTFTRRLVAGPVPPISESTPADVPGVSIVEAAGPWLESFLDIQMLTWPEDGGTRPERLDRLRRTAAAPGLSRFLALVDGRPAATAALHVIDGVAWLNSGATLQPFRSRGVQTALIRHRLALARDGGADLVCSLGRTRLGQRAQPASVRTGTALRSGTLAAPGLDRSSVLPQRGIIWSRIRCTMQKGLWACIGRAILPS